MFRFPSPTFAPEDGTGSAPPSSGASSSPASDGAGVTSTPSAPSGASTPSATPSVSPPTETGSPTAPPASATPVESEASLFDAIFSPQDEDGIAPAAPAAPQAAPVAPAVPKAEAPVVAAKPAEPAPQVPPQAPAPAAGPQEASPLPSPGEPAKLAEQLQANREALIDALAQSEYSLTPAEIEALGLTEDSGPAISRIMARTHFTVMKNAMNFLAKAVPEMIQRHTSVSEAARASWDAFYGKYPDIKRTDHHALVQRYATTYRTMHPSATKEQMMEDVALMVRTAAKIPQAPLAPGAKPNGQAKPSSAFVPAMSGPAAPPQLVEAGEWDFLNQNPEE